MITLTTEQAQQIEEALDTAYGLAESGWAEHKYATALATIRAARAQGQAEQEPVAIADGTFNHNCPIGTPLYAAPIEPVKQEPVAWVAEDVCDGQFINGRKRRIWWECIEGAGTPLYAAPVRTKDLTDDEIDRIACNVSHKEFARAVIAADREKNK
jgi:hypothetical protein